MIFTECTKKMIDLIFLIDGSGSISSPSFKLVKNWIINITEGFDISDHVHVAVVSD